MTVIQKKPIDLFFSYAHDDADLAVPFRELLARHLNSAAGFEFTHRHDLEIFPGSDWRKVLDTWIDQVDGGVFCVSPCFLSSSFCMDVELKRLMDAGKFLFPILLDDVSYDHSDLKLLTDVQIFAANPPHNDRPFRRSDRKTFAFEAFKRLQDKLRGMP